MRPLIVAATLALALPGPALAATFNGSWELDGAALTDPGLVVAGSGPAGFSLDLANGQSATIDLFRIWTPEGSVGADDLVPRGLALTLRLESHPTSGSVAGTSAGHRALGLQWGAVDWSGPLTLTVGGGSLSVALDDVAFNAGLLGLRGGPAHGAAVRATFNYVAPIALPPALVSALLGLAALGLCRAPRHTRAPRPS